MENNGCIFCLFIKKEEPTTIASKSFFCALHYKAMREITANVHYSFCLCGNGSISTSTGLLIFQGNTHLLSPNFIISGSGNLDRHIIRLRLLYNAVSSWLLPVGVEHDVMLCRCFLLSSSLGSSAHKEAGNAPTKHSSLMVLGQVVEWCSALVGPLT